MPSSTRRWLALVVVVGAALRFVPIWFGLPYPQARPDEETAIGHALGVLRGDLNPHFFHWPSLTFYLFAGMLGAAAGLWDLAGADGPMTFADHALITRAVVAFAGALTLVVLFRLAQRVAGDTTALLAAAFLAVSLLHVRESHFAMTDVLMTLLLWTSLALVLRAAETAGQAGSANRICALAGLAGGLAASTKYSAAAAAVAMVAVQVLWFAIQPSRMRSWRAWLPSVAFGAAFVAGFLVATPYAVLDYAKFSEDLRFDFTHLSEGHNGIRLGRGWMYHVTHSLPYGVGFAACVAALVGVVPFVRHHGRAAFVLGAFAVPFYVAIGSGYTVFFRYVLPLVPLVCLLAAAGVYYAAGWITRTWNISRAPVLPILAALTLGPGLLYSAWFDVLLARTDTRVRAGEWLTPRLQPGETLHDTGSNYTRLDLWRVPVVHLEYNPRTNDFAGPDAGPPDWLVLQESRLRAYASTPGPLAQLARTDYELLYEVRGRRGRDTAVYDLQDAFFMPFSGFADVLRPGPDISIYRRRAPDQRLSQRKAAIRGSRAKALRSNSRRVSGNPLIARTPLPAR